MGRLAPCSTARLVVVGGCAEEFQHRMRLAREVVAGIGEQTHLYARRAFAQLAVRRRGRN